MFVLHNVLQMFVLHNVVQMFLHMLSVSLSGVGSLSRSVFESNYLWRLFFYRHLNCEFCIKMKKQGEQKRVKCSLVHSLIEIKSTFSEAAVCGEMFDERLIS